MGDSGGLGGQARGLRSQEVTEVQEGQNFIVKSKR